jgi:hypothetical protein
MEARDIICMFEESGYKGRHGDVIIVADDDAKPDGAVRQDRVLAFGEVTGHSHQIVRGSAKVRDVANSVAQRLVEVTELSYLDHEEHKTSRLPKGTYRSGIQAQWTPEGLRRVED